MFQLMIILKKELSVSQILRIDGKQFRQVKKRFSIGHDGRCAIDVIMSCHGWDGKDDSDAPKRLSIALLALQNARVSEKLIIQLNVFRATFDKIANYLDKSSL